MSSTSSSRPSEAVPSAPVFSYAQAAKGRASTTTTPALQSNHATSGVSTPHKDNISAVNTPSAGSERGVGSVNGSHDPVSRSNVYGDASSTENKLGSSSKAFSSPSSPSFGTASTATLPKEEKDDDFVLVGHSSESTKDRHLPNGNIMEKSGEEKEGRRGKKGKKPKSTDKEGEKEKEKEEVKQEVLVPAPLPTVNFWQQRREEAAKAKPASAQAPLVVSSGSPASTSGPKSTASKARTKVANPEEGDKGASLNGSPKDSSKSQKKGSEATHKSKEEQPTKRAGPRGSRSADPEERAVVSHLPPPVEDAISWPTPETALEEEKRKAQEKSDKEEKDEANSNKQPRPKEKWVTVPYIPTVTFNTPMPTRGARGRGGARGGRTDATGRSGHASGEKSASTTASPSAGTEGRSARESGVRATSVPPVPSRQLNEQAGARNQRKPTPGGEKARNESTKNDAAAAVDSRNLNAGVPTEPSSGQGQDQSIRDATKPYKQDPIQGGVSESNSAQPRVNRQGESGPRISDMNFSGKDGNPVARDRAEGRSDRGRGGFRGRGGHNNFQNNQHPQHAYANGHSSQVPNGYPVRQSSGPYSPPLQPPFANQYMSAPPRNGRNGNASRSQSIPNNGMYRQYGGAPSQQHMPSLQTSNPMFDYSMQPISTGPYNPYIDSVSILAMVTMQLEYYFSIDNLCKDVYMRKHMDSQGYVFLSFIAGFKRIQSLTQDFDLLKWACIESDIIELVKGGDGIDRLRRKEGWEKWVLTMEERDEAARHSGPEFVMVQHSSRAQSLQQMMGSNHLAMSPPAFSPNGTEQVYRPYTNGASMDQPINGNGHYHPETPLSAAVPDFVSGLSNGNHDPLEADITFGDEEVAALMVVFASPKGSDDSKPNVFRKSSSRTFSNGSIDERTIAEELHDEPRQGRPLTNGAREPESSPEDTRRPRSPFAPLSPTTSAPLSNNPPVMWVKGRQGTVSEQTNTETFTSFRARALKHREASISGETHKDMRLLYAFWSHFLCRNFNLTMYNEFRQYALEDARHQAMGGMKNLISFYDEVLNSKKKVIPETLALHYIEIVKNEAIDGERPAFTKLRTAWRNGALDMKSRKKIDKLVDLKLREELERAPFQKTTS